MSLPGLTTAQGPETGSLACFRSVTARAKVEVERKVREAEETRRRLKREYYERRAKRAA